ncbi:hypothetical protein BKA14_000336 [Actinoplanes abujensis]|uniref:Uncharacterized protein n=1 Tax=Paractinoplanes abujensis TaxID=882441 RepID=A0A7W7FXQ7_9ACTN|nr:hypothetical protein [Actinoplanes abujensis]
MIAQSPTRQVDRGGSARRDAVARSGDTCPCARAAGLEGARSDAAAPADRRDPGDPSSDGRRTHGGHRRAVVPVVVPGCAYEATRDPGGRLKPVLRRAPALPDRPRRRTPGLPHWPGSRRTPHLPHWPGRRRTPHLPHWPVFHSARGLPSRPGPRRTPHLPHWSGFRSARGLPSRPGPRRTPHLPHWSGFRSAPGLCRERGLRSGIAGECRSRPSETDRGCVRRPGEIEAANARRRRCDAEDALGSGPTRGAAQDAGTERPETGGAARYAERSRPDGGNHAGPGDADVCAQVSAGDALANRGGRRRPDLHFAGTGRPVRRCVPAHGRPGTGGGVRAVRPPRCSAARDRAIDCGRPRRDTGRTPGADDGIPGARSARSKPQIRRSGPVPGWRRCPPRGAARAGRARRIARCRRRPPRRTFQAGRAGPVPRCRRRPPRRTAPTRRASRIARCRRRPPRRTAPTRRASRVPRCRRRPPRRTAPTRRASRVPRCRRRPPRRTAPTRRASRVARWHRWTAQAGR